MQIYKIIPTIHFERELKRLAKKYNSLKRDVSQVITKLETAPTTGTPLGKGVFKIRFAIGSKNKGKSGGGRIITYFIAEDQTVHLLSIYDKSEFDTISDRDIIDLLNALE